MGFGINMDYCAFENTQKAMEQCIEMIDQHMNEYGPDSFRDFTEGENGGSRDEKMAKKTIHDTALELLQALKDLGSPHLEDFEF